MKKTIVALFLCIWMPPLQAIIYSCNLRQALMYLQEHADDTTCVFVDIDVHGMEHLLTRDYTDTIKHAHELCQRQRKEGFELKSTINDTMKVVDPIYLAAAKITQHCIGITRRQLRWSHLVRGVCYKHDIKKETKRLLIVIPADNPEYPKIVECNTGIIYLEDANRSDAMFYYMRKWAPDCTKIMLLDTEATSLQASMLDLYRLGISEVTGLLIQTTAKS